MMVMTMGIVTIHIVKRWGFWVTWCLCWDILISRPVLIHRAILFGLVAVISLEVT